MIKLKSLKTQNLTKKIIQNILTLKDETWKNGLYSQQKHFKNNYKYNDYHNLMFYRDMLIGYTSFRKRKIKTKKEEKSYLLLDAIVIKKRFRRKGYSSNLMEYNNNFVAKKGLKSLLFCTNKNVKFFSKNRWKIANRKNFILMNYFSRNKIMTFKFKVKKNTKYSIFI